MLTTNAAVLSCRLPLFTLILTLLFLSGCSVTVPNLVGMDRAAAPAALEDAHLALGTVSSAYSDTEPLGSILTQNPAAGSQAPRDSAVALVVSRGRVILADPETPAAASAQDGLTWATAYDTLQEAVDAAYFRSAEVWAARGSFGENRAAKDAFGSLLLREGIAVYGGFSAAENFREERNWSTNLTVIEGAAALAGEPAVHVVTGAEGARLDGFTVRGGDGGESSGGGMINSSPSMAVANCAFTGNTANSGGAISCWYVSSSLEVDNCLFARNSCGNHGGSILTDMAALTLRGCTFDRNTADNDGGAVCSAGADVTVSNTTFSRNSASGNGGGIYAFNGGDVTLTNCLFHSNEALRGGALTSAFSLTNAVLTNCTFSENTASESGGAVYTYHGSFAATNCILWNNTGANTIQFGDSTAVTLSHCCINGGWPEGGTGILDDDPQFLDADAFDFRLQSGSPCLNAGTWVDAPDTDLRGVSRPQGSGIDLGAYEMADADYE